MSTDKPEEIIPQMFKMPKQFTRKDLRTIRHNSPAAAKARKARKHKNNHRKSMGR